jgi:hypothetical protein
MLFLFAIVIAAASLGAIAPALWKSQPHLAKSAVVFLPPLLLLVRYVTFVRANDWEGTGAIALFILALAWMVISSTAANLVLRRR